MWLRPSQKTLVSQSGLGCLLTATGDRRDWGWWWPTEQPFVPLSDHPHPKHASLSIPFPSTSLCNRPAAGLPESTASLSILLSHPAKQPHIQRLFCPLHLPPHFLSLQIWSMTLLQMKQVMFTTVLKEWRGLVNSVFVPAPELILYFQLWEKGVMGVLFSDWKRYKKGEKLVSSQRGKNRADKVAQHVKVPATQPEELNLTWQRERTNTPKLSSDLHTHVL